MSNSQTLEIIRAHFESLNWGNIADGMHLMDDSAVWTNVATGQVFQGAQGYVRFWSGWRAAFPNFWLEIEQLNAGQNWAVAEYIFRGTHKGLLYLPTVQLRPTGREVTLNICETYQIDNGRLSAVHFYTDTTSLARQLGLLPCSEMQPYSVLIAN
jgi:predicted ester cyclase